MILNMQEAVACFLEPITVETRSGSLVNGRWETVDGTFETKADVQPAPKEMLQNLPEGAQRIGAKAFWLMQPLQIVDDKQDKMSYNVLYKSRRYKLTGVSDWEEFGFFKYLGTLDQQQTI